MKPEPQVFFLGLILICLFYVVCRSLREKVTLHATMTFRNKNEIVADIEEAGNQSTVTIQLAIKF